MKFKPGDRVSFICRYEFQFTENPEWQSMTIRELPRPRLHFNDSWNSLGTDISLLTSDQNLMIWEPLLPRPHFFDSWTFAGMHAPLITSY